MKKWEYEIVSQRINEIGSIPISQRGVVCAPNAGEALIRAIVDRHWHEDYSSISTDQLIDMIDKELCDGFKEDYLEGWDEDGTWLEYHFGEFDFGAEAHVIETDDMTIEITNTIAHIFKEGNCHEIEVGGSTIAINNNEIEISVDLPNVVFRINSSTTYKMPLANPESLTAKKMWEALAQALANHYSKIMDFGNRRLKFTCTAEVEELSED
jgi:hypothetical protein